MCNKSNILYLKLNMLDWHSDCWKTFLYDRKMINKSNKNSNAMVNKVEMRDARTVINHSCNISATFIIKLMAFDSYHKTLSVYSVYQLLLKVKTDLVLTHVPKLNSSSPNKENVCLHQTCSASVMTFPCQTSNPYIFQTLQSHHSCLSSIQSKSCPTFLTQYLSSCVR